MVERDGSAPPSPPPPPFPAPPPAYKLERQPTGSGQQEHPGESETQRALRIAIATRAAQGAPPNGAIKGDEGTGIWKIIVQIQRTLEETQKTLKQVLDELAAERAEREKRGGWAARVGWRIIDTLIPVGVTALLLAISGHLR